MSMEPTCDVRRTSVGVKLFSIRIVELDRKTHTPIQNEKGDPVNRPLLLTQDLCPEALDRLVDKIKAGTAPPVKRKKDAPEAIESKAAASNNGKVAKVKK